MWGRISCKGFQEQFIEKILVPSKVFLIFQCDIPAESRGQQYVAAFTLIKVQVWVFCISASL